MIDGASSFLWSLLYFMVKIIKTNLYDGAGTIMKVKLCFFKNEETGFFKKRAGSVKKVEPLFDSKRIKNCFFNNRLIFF